MDYSLHLYGEVRQHLRTVIRECAAADRRVAIFGRGEAAELSYLALKEFGLEPLAIFDVEGGHEFLGMPVLPISQHAEVPYDLMIVATLGSPGEPIARLINDGVPKEKLFPLRQEPRAAPQAGGIGSIRQRSSGVRGRVMAITGKRVCITGGAGFIGSYLVQRLDRGTTRSSSTTTCIATRFSSRTSTAIRSCA